MQEAKGVNPLLVLAIIGVLLVGGIAFIFARGTNPVTVPESVQEVQDSQSEAMEDSPNAAGTDPVTSELVDPETPTSDSMEGDVRVIAVEAGSFYFLPNDITVKKGQKVRLELTSKDMMHDFVVDELDIRVPVTRAGNTSTIEFVANEVGQFEYYCSVANHRAQGQVGTLIVEE